MVAVMISGKIVRFDRSRGYGFIAPDHGGEDVFVHVRELDAENVATGTRVEFSVVDGERGLKAYAVRVLGSEKGNGSAPAQPSGTVADDETCVVISVAEYGTLVTDVLLTVAPDLTGTQIVEVRRRLTEFARGHGWVD